jgi:hypothetical protein
MRVLLAGLFWMGSLTLWGQAARLPEAPTPATEVASVRRDRQWERLESLVPGESLEVRERVDGVKSECVLGSVTDSVLTCAFTPPYGVERRVSYPKSAIERVWVTRKVHGPSGKAMLIGVGIGAAVGALVVGSGTQTKTGTLSGLFLGGALGGSVVLGRDPFGYEEHTQRVLIYRLP